MEENIAAKKVGIIGIIGNFILLGLKFLGGFYFKSQALIADAINSLGDVFSSIVTYVGGKISSVPEDEDHEFGHGKAEFVASFLIGLFMIVVSIDMLYSSIHSIILNEAFKVSKYLLFIPIITIVVKVILYMYVKKVGNKMNSLLIKANAKDHRNDIFISIGVIIGIVFGYYGIYIVDGIVGAIISCIIVVTGVKIVYEAYDVLIDKCVDVEVVKEVRAFIEGIEKVNHIDSIKSKPTGKLHMLIIKISVDSSMTVRESHKIAGKIRHELTKRPEIYDVLVHINPDE
ncbi:MAG: cation transporter [Clostridia bacterium]|nr:cation transporter [Clostridia bacterium]